MKKEMDFSESSQCLWRSQFEPQPGQMDPGAREGWGVQSQFRLGKELALPCSLLDSQHTVGFQLVFLTD